MRGAEKPIPFTTEAVYENGVLKVASALPVVEGERVEVVVRPLAESAPPTAEFERPGSFLEFMRRVDAEVGEDEDDDYDIVQALNENRRRDGAARLLLPPGAE